MYSLAANAGSDIFRGWGISPLAKWVDVHIFFRLHTEVGQSTMCVVQNGSGRYETMGGADRTAVEGGAGERAYQAVLKKNLMRTAQQFSKAYPAEDQLFTYTNAYIDELMGLQAKPVTCSSSLFLSCSPLRTPWFTCGRRLLVQCTGLGCWCSIAPATAKAHRSSRGRRHRRT